MNNHGVIPVILRLPQVILDVGVEVNGFGPAIVEDGLTDVLFVVGWHGTVAAQLPAQTNKKM